MSAELISLKNPRRLVMAVLLLVLLGIAVPLAAGITAPEVTYPGSPEESIQLDNGDTVTLEGGKQVEIIGSGVPDTPIGHTCEVSGDVAGERRDLYPNFETGSTGDYTITCRKSDGPMEIRVGDEAPYREWNSAYDREHGVAIASKLFPFAVAAVLIGALVWYAALARKRSAQLRSWQAAGLPPVGRAKGSTVPGLALLGFGMLVYVALGLFAGSLIAGLYTVLFIGAGIFLFANGGTAQEKYLREHVDGWRGRASQP